MATFTAKELALLAGTDAKTFRRYVRAQAASTTPIVHACGQGNRYGFSQEDAHALVEGFAAWRRTNGRKDAPARTLAELHALMQQDEDGFPGDEIDPEDEGA